MHRVIAFASPGQGAETPGMGLAVAARNPDAAALLEEACDATRLDLRRIIGGGRPALFRTEVLQPALTAVALGAASELDARGIRADVLLGHSAGEVAAFCLAGVMSHTAAIRVAACRGAAMAREAARNPGGMLALRARDETEVERAVAHGRAAGRVDLAGHLGPGLWALSGEAPALKAIGRWFDTTPISAAGAWHSPLMEGAMPELRQALREAAVAPPLKSLVSNATGRPVVSSDDPVELLVSQLVRPMRLAEALAAIEDVTDVVVLGPRQPLAGLLRRNLGRNVRIHSTSELADLDRAVEELTS